jgi:DHA2 family multidrug resistance protein
MHAELSGLVDSTAAFVNGLTAAGSSREAALAQLNALVQGQSVMIATNQMMFIVALAFGFASLVIWLAPKPSRTVDPANAGAH